MKSESEMLNDLTKYCSCSERCLFDVRKKMQAADLSAAAEKRIIDKLLMEKFVDEKRFARSFVHDKFQLNHWGRIKIAYELKARGIQPDDCNEAVETIDEDEYIAVLTDVLTHKKRTVKGHSPQDIFLKLCRFAVARGFETPLVVSTLKKISKDIDDD